MNKSVIIVAGGSGTRMGYEEPKQFIKWCGKPILMHTIEQFVRYDKKMNIVLVLPKDQRQVWNSLCEQYDFGVELSIANGGCTRFESVKSGLEIITEECLVGIHDGVRPLVSMETLENCYVTAGQEGCAIPVIDSFESIREIQGEGSRSVNRTLYKMVQTPQVFVLSAIKAAYQLPYCEFYTDDASVYESAGNKVVLTSGNRENIKITTPVDLLVGEALRCSDTSC